MEDVKNMKKNVQVLPEILNSMSSGLGLDKLAHGYILLYNIPSPSTLTSFPAPGKEDNLHTMALPLPCFTVGVTCSE